MVALLDHRESSDRYQGELFRDGQYRVAVCRDGIQWVLQRQVAPKKGRAGARWKSIGYFTTKKALTRLWHSKTGGPNTGLARLPECIEWRAV